MQAVMRRKLGLFGHVCRMKQKNQRRHDGDDGGNWQERKTMQKMDG